MANPSSLAAYPQVIVTGIVQETRDAKTFFLADKSGRNPLRYFAGQFITLVFEKPGQQQERRSFSFSSSPETDPRAAITIKRIPNGAYSRQFVDRVAEGAVFDHAGVSGFFCLPDNLALFDTIYFFAAGSGITPIFSLIKTTLAAHPHISIHLIYSSSTPADTIFYDTLNDHAARSNGRLQIRYLFSRTDNMLRDRLNNFKITDILERSRDYPQWKKTLFFVCGPFDYMDTVLITLLTEGVPRAQIRKENFSTYRPEMKRQPPDRSAHDVTFLIGEAEYKTSVQYPESILSRALAEGIPLPYSCESGQCGACTAKCESGKVWMAYNEVLTDKEIEAGMVLTCTAFPNGGDVILRY